jgi:hypothetical protein
MTVKGDGIVIGHRAGMFEAEEVIARYDVTRRARRELEAHYRQLASVLPSANGAGDLRQNVN